MSYFLTLARFGTFLQLIGGTFLISSVIKDFRLRRMEEQLRILISGIVSTNWPRRLVVKVYESLNRHIPTISFILGSLITIVIVVAVLSVEVFTYWNLLQTFKQRPQLRTPLTIAAIMNLLMLIFFGPKAFLINRMNLTGIISTPIALTIWMVWVVFTLIAGMIILVPYIGINVLFLPYRIVDIVTVRLDLTSTMAAIGTILTLLGSFFQFFG